MLQNPARIVPQRFSFESIYGTRIHYALHDAEPDADRPLTLVCTHGFGGNLSTWNDVLPALTKRHRVVRLDLRGFGYSDKPDDWRYDATDQAEVVSELVLRLGLKNVVLVGHSYGGAVALLAFHRLAAVDPAIAKGLVIIDGAAFPLRFPFQVAVYRYSIAQWLAATVSSPEWRVEFTLRKLFFQKARVTDERIHRYSYFLDLPGSQMAFARVARSIQGSDSGVVTKGLKHIYVPCLVIWGEHDKIIPKSHAQLFANAIPNSVIRFIPSCGHAPQEEQPDATSAAILTFLELLI